MLCPLDERQKEILRQAFREKDEPSGDNPLDELTPEERETLLEFTRENFFWKSSLLDDWLHDRPSGKIQFIRERYGPGWLDRVRAVHWQEYLRVGDSIEVSNSLWEWVRPDAPDSIEWYSCQVIALREEEGASASCTVRFETGEEREIPGVYRWNRVNWRFAVGS